MKTTFKKSAPVAPSSRGKAPFWMTFSFIAAISLAWPCATSALALPPGYLLSSACFRPVATLDQFLTTNKLAPSLPWINLSIELPLNNEDFLNEFLVELYDLGSPYFEQYLTPGQFTEWFGPTPAQYKSVISFVRAKGLTVTGIYSSRTILDVRGTVNQIQRAFKVTLEVYWDPFGCRYFYAPNVEPTLPPNLSNLDIIGLDDYAIILPGNLSLIPVDRGGILENGLSFVAATAVSVDDLDPILLNGGQPETPCPPSLSPAPPLLLSRP